MRGVFRIRIDKTKWVKESDIIAAGAWGCLSQALAERQIEKSPEWYFTINCTAPILLDDEME